MKISDNPAYMFGQIFKIFTQNVQIPSDIDLKWYSLFRQVHQALKTAKFVWTGQSDLKICLISFKITDLICQMPKWKYITTNLILYIHPISSMHCTMGYLASCCNGFYHLFFATHQRLESACHEGWVFIYLDWVCVSQSGCKELSQMETGHMFPYPVQHSIDVCMVQKFQWYMYSYVCTTIAPMLVLPDIQTCMLLLPPLWEYIANSIWITVYHIGMAKILTVYDIPCTTYNVS